MIKNILLALFFTLYFISYSYAKTSFIEIEIHKVLDGDSFKAFSQEKPIEIRLYGINSPEYNHHYGESSKRKLKEILAKSKKFIAEVFYKDFYGRAVAIVYLGNGESAQEKLIKSGATKVYSKYCKIDLCNYWSYLASNAQKKHIGLWK